MSRVWPVTLPQIQSSDLQRSREPNFVEFKTDAGPKKRRRLTTRPRSSHTFTVELTGAQLTTFDAFFRDTIEDGTLNFEWTDPVTDESASITFLTEPQWVLVVPAADPDDRVYQAKFSLEIA